MGYIYRLPDGFDFHPNNPLYDFSYISVKKKHIPFSNEISIYIKDAYRNEGIFAFGNILSDIVYKTTELPLSERNVLFNRSFFQIKVRFHYKAVHPLVDIKYLKQFPSYNRDWFQKPKNLYKIYWDAGVTSDIEYIYDTFRDDFDQVFVPDENKWVFYVHLLREKTIKYFWKVREMLKNGKCLKCGTEAQYEQFLEIHDSYNIDFHKEYKSLELMDYITVCPNCHKILHENMRNGKQ